MTVVAKLSADLYANTSRFETGMRRARSSMGSFTSKVDRSMARSTRSFDRFNKKATKTSKILSRTSREFAGFAAAAATALSVEKITRYSDKYKQLEGRLKIVSKNMGEVRDIQEKLFAVAQRTRQPLEAVTNLYTRLNMALGENKRAQYDVLGISETVSMALAVTGEGAAQSASAILQFSQAIQSDFKNSAQEINSIIDSAPRLAIALQKSFGDGTKSLKQLAKDGDLSTDTVLRALERLSPEARKIALEFSNMQVTVSQALTRLDNAFLKLVGQSKMVQDGTTSLAAGITLLAENLGYVATAASLLAIVLGVKLLSGITASASAFARSTAAIAANSAAVMTATREGTGNTRMALAMVKAQTAAAGTVGLTTIAVNAQGDAIVRTSLRMRGFAASATLASSAMALMGGPIGVALIGAYGLMSLAAYNAGKAQRLMNLRVSGFKDSAKDYIGADNERRKVIEGNVRGNIESLKKELQAINILFDAYKKKSFGGRFLQNFGANVGLGDGAYDMAREGAALEGAIAEMEALQGSLNDIKNPTGSTGTSDDGKPKKKDKFAGLLADLEKESAELETQISLFGKKESAINRATKMIAIEHQLMRAGIKITKEQRDMITAHLDQIELQSEAYNKLGAQQDILADQEQKRQEALDQLNTTFSSAFEDAITGGEKFSNVLKGLLNDIAQLLLKTQVTEPLMSGLFGGKSSGGGLLSGLFGGGSGGGILSSVAGFFGGSSFATGIDSVPRDMNARIHKGERIVTRQENEAMQRGSSGGDTYHIDARGAETGVEDRIRDVLLEVRSLEKRVPNIAASTVQDLNRRSPKFLGR